MNTRTVSKTRCELGEGAHWNPDRGTFMWFDILGKRLLEAAADGEREWRFDRYVSAAGRIDQDTLLIATSTDLILFSLSAGEEQRLVAMEEENSVTRCNDGRADPYGGFWIGTMGIKAEPEVGTIYRYYKGELRALFPGITIPNAISFSPDGGHAYFADTARKRIWSVDLDPDGWPKGEPEVWQDLDPTRFNPDGAIVDAEGNLWNAQWGFGNVTCFSPKGDVLDTVSFPAAQTSCPAFGGPDLSTLYVTSAAEGLPEDDESAGLTYSVEVGSKGQEEHTVIL